MRGLGELFHKQPGVLILYLNCGLHYKNADMCEDVTYFSESITFVLLGTNRCSTSL
jgi:hypothetical protein